MSRWEGPDPHNSCRNGKKHLKADVLRDRGVQHLRAEQQTEASELGAASCWHDS